MIEIRYFAPHPALRPYLSSYYWFESNLPAFSDMMRAELPQIRLITRGTASNHYANGMVRQAMPAQLQGPTAGPVRFAADGPLHLFGVGLLPRGWASLIREPADRIADDCVDLGAILGPAADVVVAAMVQARNDAERVAAADRFFLALLERSHAAPLWFTRLADHWLTDAMNPDVDVLVRASGMSARSIERMARRIYGASPKLLARKYRALRAAVRIGTGEASGWRDFCENGMAGGDFCNGGFYDQAHFIREFKQFTGMTPSRFVDGAAAVTRLTIARKTMLPAMPKLAL
jgi:AraC-like DNA-binding protein